MSRFKKFSRPNIFSEKYIKVTKKLKPFSWRVIIRVQFKPKFHACRESFLITRIWWKDQTSELAQLCFSCYWDNLEIF